MISALRGRPVRLDSRMHLFAPPDIRHAHPIMS
jgi:hypothetical protein